MLIYSNFDAVLIGVKENSFEQNGKLVPYYSASIEINDESGMLSCTKEIFDGVKNGLFPKYSKQTFTAEYNTAAEKKKLRLVDIVPSPTKK